MLTSSRFPRGTAIFFAIGILLVLGSVTIGLIETLLPRNRDISGIERSNQAFYEAETAVELTMLALTKTWPALQPTISSGSAASYRSHIAVSRAVSSLYPEPWTGNSPFDRDWARISIGSPIVLYVPSGSTDYMNDLRLVFRVPNLDGSGSTTEALSGANSLEILQWTMTAPISGGPVETIAGAPWHRIHRDQIRSSTDTTTRIDNFESRQGNPNGDTTTGAVQMNFFMGGKTCWGINCTLKISIIRPLLLTDGRTAPFLEYQVSGTGIINPSTIISAQGVTGGYRRAVRRENSHQSTLEILDYATAQ